MIIYGRNVLIEALKSDFLFEEIYFETNLKQEGKIDEIVALAKRRGIKIELLDKRKLSKLSNSEEHQGVAAKIDFHLTSLNELFEDHKNLNKSYIYISEATFEHNVGAIIRTAECAGLGGVIIPNDIEITSTVIKISTGAAFHIPIIGLNIYQAVKDFKDNGFEIIGIERDGQNLFNSDMKNPALLIIGGEDKSLSTNLRERCDKIIEIPQAGKVNSLNMSVAAGIVIFQHINQLKNV